MLRSLTLTLVALTWIPIALAEESRESDTPDGPVPLFDAISKEWVKVKYIPLGADKANVIIENLLEDDIDLELPDAFGARHILGQLGGGGAGAFGFGQGQGAGQGAGGGQGFGGGGQNVGGGFGNGAGGGNFGQGGQFGGQFGQGGFGQGFGAGRGNGFFRVAPDKKRKLSVQTVCLQHGKPDPNPRMTYELVPLTTVNDDPAIEALCKSLSQKKVDQVVAQAAAWNIANRMTWNELAKLNRRESRYLGNERMFTKQQLATAQEFSRYVNSQADQKRSSRYPRIALEQDESRSVGYGFAQSNILSGR